MVRSRKHAAVMEPRNAVPRNANLAVNVVQDGGQASGPNEGSAQRYRGFCEDIRRGTGGLTDVSVLRLKYCPTAEVYETSTGERSFGSRQYGD